MSSEVENEERRKFLKYIGMLVVAVVGLVLGACKETDRYQIIRVTEAIPGDKEPTILRDGLYVFSGDMGKTPVDPTKWSVIQEKPFANKSEIVRDGSGFGIGLVDKDIVVVAPGIYLQITSDKQVSVVEINPTDSSLKHAFSYAKNKEGQLVKKFLPTEMDTVSVKPQYPVQIPDTSKSKQTGTGQ